MFGDLFGSVSSEVLNNVNQAHLVNHMTLILALLDKKIISVDDLANAKALAIHAVEQEWERTRQEANQEFDEKHPGVRQLFERLTEGGGTEKAG